MLWYKKYILNYSAKTQNLSILEHGVYNILLDYYYKHHGMPGSLRALNKILLEFSPQFHTLNHIERDAIKTVSDIYFPIGEDGQRHNKRADEEIAIWSDKCQKNRELGKLGGRPKGKRNGLNKNPDGIGKITDSLSTEKTVRLTDSVTKKNPIEVIYNKEHHGSNSCYSENAIPETETVFSKESEFDQLNFNSPQSEKPQLTNEQYTEIQNRAVQIAVKLRALDIGITYSHPFAQQWADQDITDQQLDQAVDLARQSKPEGPIPAKYLAKCLETALDTSKNHSKTNGSSASQWWIDDSAADAKARELGIEASPYDSYESLRAKIRAAIAKNRQGTYQTIPEEIKSHGDEKNGIADDSKSEPNATISQNTGTDHAEAVPEETVRSKMPNSVKKELEEILRRYPQFQPPQAEPVPGFDAQADPNEIKTETVIEPEQDNQAEF